MRKASAVWIALCVLLVAAIGGTMLSMVTRTSMRQVGTAQDQARLRAVADAALASVENHLKITGWSNRWVFIDSWDGPASIALSFDGVACTVYAQDRKLPGDIAEQGTVDLFVAVPDTNPQLGVFHRVNLKSVSALAPRALTIQRELSVREDFSKPAVRDQILAQVDADQAEAARREFEADAIARAMAAAAAQNRDPAQLETAARNEASEAANEKTFREAYDDGRQKSLAGDLAAAETALDSAVATAGGAPALHKGARLGAAKLQLARTQYTRAMVSAGPTRTGFLNEAVRQLTGVLGDPDASCTHPSAALLLAQVRVALDNPLTDAARLASRDRAMAEMRRTLRGRDREAFEGGTVLIQELFPHFEAQVTETLAFAEANFEADPDWDDYWMEDANQRLLLAPANGGTAVPITEGEFHHPLFFMPGGQTIFGTVQLDYMEFAFALFDRTGRVLRTYEPMYPLGTVIGRRNPNFQIGYLIVGATLAPDKQTVVCWGYRGDDWEPAYWGLDLASGAVRKLRGPYPEDVDGRQDPVSFSPDGNWVAFMDPGAGVRVAPANSFLTGNAAGTVVWTPTYQRYEIGRGRFEKGPANLPGMGWTQGGGSDKLILFAGVDDDTHADRDNLVMVDPASLARSTVPLGGFRPGACVPYKNRGRIALLSNNGARIATVDHAAGAFTSALSTRDLAGGPYWYRPGRGPGETIYLTSPMDRPGVHRLDLETFDITPIIQLTPSTGDRLLAALYPISQ